MIDMLRLNRVRIDVEAGMAHVQAGAKIAPIQAAALAPAAVRFTNNCPAAAMECLAALSAVINGVLRLSEPAVLKLPSSETRIL